jgi:hypothetical protein
MSAIPPSTPDNRTTTTQASATSKVESKKKENTQTPELLANVALANIQNATPAPLNMSDEQLQNTLNHSLGASGALDKAAAAATPKEQAKHIKNAMNYINSVMMEFVKTNMDSLGVSTKELDENRQAQQKLLRDTGTSEGYYAYYDKKTGSTALSKAQMKNTIIQTMRDAKSKLSGLLTQGAQMTQTKVSAETQGNDQLMQQASSILNNVLKMTQTLYR